VIDAATRTLYLDAMTTPDGGATKQHLVYALSADDGSVRSGWPADVGALVSGFDAEVQNQCGGLLLLGGKVYVPYGGHYGDCGTYYGRVVGIDVGNPASAVSFRTRAEGGGIWAPGGLASDGTSVFAATGNTFGATTWQDGEGILRLPQDLAFSQQPADYWAATDWQDLDSGDVDIGGSGPVLFDLPSGTPAHAAISRHRRGGLLRQRLGQRHERGPALPDAHRGQGPDLRGGQRRALRVHALSRHAAPSGTVASSPRADRARAEAGLLSASGASSRGGRSARRTRPAPR
jgi:hypothetical protein